MFFLSRRLSFSSHSEEAILLVILVSACLLGIPCRYDGQSKRHPVVAALAGQHTLIPCCPEVLGGLPTPRTPAERRGKCVISRTGDDVTAFYENGARCALRLCQENGCTLAIFKDRSPSCGTGEIYDGTFSGTRVPGDGVAAALLRAHGISVCGEHALETLPPDAPLYAALYPDGIRKERQ